MSNISNMTSKKSQLMIETISKEALESLKLKFGNNLVSVVLFGSYPRGTSTEKSDIDVLIIADNIPQNSEKKWLLLKDLRFLILEKYGKLLETVVMDTAEFIKNIEFASPLFISFFTGFKIIYDPKKAFRSKFIQLSEGLSRTNIRYGESGTVWEISKLARDAAISQQLLC